MSRIFRMIDDYQQRGDDPCSLAERMWRDSQNVHFVGESDAELIGFCVCAAAVVLALGLCVWWIA
jgi:hypothetical protein